MHDDFARNLLRNYQKHAILADEAGLEQNLPLAKAYNIAEMGAHLAKAAAEAEAAVRKITGLAVLSG